MADGTFPESWVDPAGTAILGMEMQRGVVGDLSRIAPLVDAVKAGDVVANLAGLMHAGRAAGIPVIHCNAHFRADRKGSAKNCGMLAYAMKNPEQVLEGSPQAQVMPELGPEPGDFTIARYHGISPFSGTALDITLRNLGVKTVVVGGVSVNVGVFGLCVEAINLGYRVILPRDCVAGFPADYVDAVIANSLAHLCTVTTSAAVTAIWAA